jgi:hypothetical protein
LVIVVRERKQVARATFGRITLRPTCRCISPPARDGDPLYNSFWDGKLDEVAIYSTALNATSSAPITTPGAGYKDDVTDSPWRIALGSSGSCARMVRRKSRTYVNASHAGADGALNLARTLR